jgi:HMG (high mobility group) box
MLSSAVPSYGLDAQTLASGVSASSFAMNPPNYPQYSMTSTTNRFDRDASSRKPDSPPSALSADSLKGKHVPRPRNAFMIFRSSFWAEAKINRTVEHDHRHISRIIGHCWNKMPEDEKEVWRQKAFDEKAAHERKYPGYRFCPTARTKKPVKRKVKRNGAVDLARCEKLADLLLSGKTGHELSLAAQTLPGKPVRVGKTARQTSQPIPMPSTVVKYASEEPPFRSPLLPPRPMYEESAGSCSSMECSPTVSFLTCSMSSTFKLTLPLDGVLNASPDSCSGPPLSRVYHNASRSPKLSTTSDRLGCSILPHL